MKVLVTGQEGQLARSIAELGKAHPQWSYRFVGRPALDLRKPGEATKLVLEYRPDVVINAAAYTGVDAAEDEPEVAFQINSDAAGEIAKAANDVGARLVQISTDYVFDGTSDTAYTEDATTNPINVYGRSKSAGEEQVRLANPQHLIIRTSWIYSPFGHNFVKTMLRLAEQRDEVSVVADQTGCPTSALELADSILQAVAHSDGWGATYHLAGSWSCSWAQFAEHIFEASWRLGGPFAGVTPVSTAEYPTRAARPQYSVLNSNRFRQEFDAQLLDSRKSVVDVVGRILAASC